MGNLCSISIPLDEVVSRCLDCFTGQANCIFNLKKNYDTLKTAREKLTAVKDDVKTRVRLAKEEGQMPRKQVEQWISEVEAAEAEINQVIEGGPQEIEKLCLGGYCSNNFKSSYRFGQKVAQKLESVATLKRDGVFEAVADRMPLATVEPRPSEPTVGMESIFDKVWSCLGQEQVGIIGLFGLGGVGKTTLLTQINNKFLNTPNDFDSVIWVVVSKDLNLQRIQDDIWKRLRSVDQSWAQKSQDEKANEIFKVLSKKKFVLLLDDIWKQLDLKEVGVPLPDKANKSKIVFTTRIKDVCGQMGAQERIEVKCLQWEQAWKLFQENVGENVLRSHPDIPKLAESVAKECDGLPLALITIGRAMASRNTTEDWTYAINTLRNSASTFSGMEEKVFARLKFSFDNLQNDAHKSCFLYCALFPEDYVIDKGRLIDYWIGEEFLCEYNKLSDARIEGHHIIGTLVNVCLLEAENGGVKMHDMMRDMALWIVSKNREKKENYFLVQAGVGLTEAPKIKKWEGTKMISLMRNEIREVRISPLCPNLTTLLLNDNRITEISDDVFDHMPNLLVLDLSNNVGLRQLPLGILKLVSLQYLNLSWTPISDLPIELGRLVNLKYLNLEGLSLLNSIPKNLLSSFLKLQVCNLNSFAITDGDLFSENEGLMEGLESLKDLQDLGISIRIATSLQRFGLSEKLQRCTRQLDLSFVLDVRSINVSSLEKLESLTIRDIDSFEVLEIDWDVIRAPIRSVSFFPNLHHVRIGGCHKLGDMTWLLFAPNIRSLDLVACDGMKKVLDIEKLGESPEVATNLNPFSKLKTLHLEDLPQLESIYPNALTFPCLEMITVFNCPQLKRLPLNSDSAKGHKITIKGGKEWWVNLHWEDEAAQNVFLSSFKVW